MKTYLIFILVYIYQSNVLATEFDFNFLNGGQQANINIIENLKNNNIPGSYVLDVNLNNKYIGKRKITIDKNDKNDICFDKDWLKTIDFEINDIFYKSVFNIDESCFYLDKELNTIVDFDYTTQSISLTVPQLGFDKKVKEKLSWDNGVGALRINYNVNAYVSEINTDVYSSFDLKGNVSEWVLSGTASASNDEYFFSIGSAERPIKSLESDLIIGKMFTNSDIVQGFGLTGLGIRKNTAQRGFDYGYKPVFSGTANSQALVSIIQNGVLVYSEVVSPGPFKIENVKLLSSGDVSLVVKEKDGTERTRIIPLTISPTMISPGDYDFEIYSGIRQEGNDQELKGVFFNGSFGYGFDGLTLKGNTVLHKNYFGIGLGFYKQLGYFGNIDIESSYNYSKNIFSETNEGASLSFTYEKGFNAHRKFIFSSDHYLSDDFVDFSSFSYYENSRVNNTKNQYNFNLSDKITDYINASLFYNYTDYWNSTDYQKSIGVTLGTVYKTLNINLTANANKSRYSDDITTSISFSLPLGKSSNLYTSFSATDDDNNFNYSSGFSSSINDNLNYSASVSGSSDNGDKYTSLATNYTHEMFNLSGHISSNKNSNTGSASINGSAIFIPSKGDFLLSRHVNGTIAIASVNDIPGVKLSRSSTFTNSNGKAIVPMSSYRLNRLDIDTSTLPLDTEIINSSQEVIPKDEAVVYMEFDYFKVRRYVFQISQYDGEYVSAGSWAITKDEKPLGFVSNHGVLIINTSDELDEFFINDCHITSDKIKQVKKVQKVVCNE